jgi:hypothetical protein
MLLKELFSPVGGPQDMEDIDWVGDLKTFIDNENEVLSNVMFPAIKKHEQMRGNPNAYKIYIKPLQTAKEMYCDKFQVKDGGDKFPKEVIIKMARQIADEQLKHIESGDYEN